MKTVRQRKAQWLRRLLIAQMLLSIVTAGLILCDSGRVSQIYSLVVGLLPAALVVAYLGHLPYANLALRTYSTTLAALGGVALSVLVIDGTGTWLNADRLILTAQVSIAVMLAATLSRSGHHHRANRSV